MLRRISTKWVLAVLAAVVVPFVGFAWYVNTQMGDRLWDVVRYYLQSIASDLADQIDRELGERSLDIELWADNPIVEWVSSNDEWQGMAGDPIEGEPLPLHTVLGAAFDSFVVKSQVYDLLLAVDAEGRLSVSNSVDGGGGLLARERLAALARRDYASESWFREAMESGRCLVDQHLSDLLPPANPDPGPHPENYHIGIAVRVESPFADDPPLGVVYGLVNWTYFQDQLLKPARQEYFQGLMGKDIYASSYAWLWRSDADTIIAHPRRSLYGKRVSEPPVDLPQLVDAARSRDLGMYPEYAFQGVRKNAAFKHCAGVSEGGLGWVVGIGIDNQDIFATINELRRVLWTATASVLGVVILWTIFIARRTTLPILQLQRHTQRVAGGDLTTRIQVDSRDELGELAAAFNRMTEELLQSREQIVKAEKDAAWREMARQVAHEIKNPLTPISLSANLLRRARDEDSPEFNAIFDRTMDLILRQVENMRAIAADFYAFAGAHKPEPEQVDVEPLLDEVLELNAAWMEELGVELEKRGPGGEVFCDRGELRRVLINLISNALEAMPEGGRLRIELWPEDGKLCVSIRDEGHGLSQEARERLFEPYFTTRTHGTGLGLAISRRIIEEMEGEIELEPVPASEGSGVVALIRIPIEARA